jgi:predicted dehydrogenase
MRPLRLAIIGFGKIAGDQHVPAIAANPRLELVATSSRTGQGTARQFTDWRQLLAEVDGLDAVAITTPPSIRHEIARTCMERGLHCLLEKPPTDTLSEIHDLAGIARDREVTLFTTWHAQHNPAVEAAADALAGQRISTMDILWHEDVRKWHPGQQWIWEPGGFGVFDPGINAFSIATKIFPGALLVRSADLFYPGDAQTPIAAEIAFASAAADGSLRCSLDWRQTGGEEWTITVRTATGVEVRLEGGGSRLLIDGVEAAVNGEGAGDGEYPDLYRTFVELIDERRSRVDVVPLRLVADCLLAGRRHQVAEVAA